MKIARPLTATMHKMHRACQDNYYSQDFISSYGKVNPVETMTKEELSKLPIRKLTPEEAFNTIYAVLYFLIVNNIIHD